MINSFPNRSSISPFRKSVNNSFSTIDERSSTKNKKRQSLKIITSPDEEEEQQQHPVSSPSTSRVRQRLSSLFRTSSPVVMTLKETFQNKRASLSTVSFTASPQQRQMEPMDDSQSTTTTLSSGSSDHMPASPADARTIFSSIPEQQNTTTVWQPSVTILSYDDQQQEEQAQPTTPKEPQFAMTRSSSSLAFQVHQVLGSTLDEVDEEIDQDWENSRNVLHQSLVSTGDRNQHFWF